MNPQDAPPELRLVDIVTIRGRLTQPLSDQQARWLRGSIAGQIRQVEFHHHGEKGLVYQHPLIRYWSNDGLAAVSGLNEGAFLLRTFTLPSTLRLGPNQIEVVDQWRSMGRVPLGPTSELVSYSFVSPYLPLNQDNYMTWQRADEAGREELLSRIVVGNLLSLSKALGLHVQQRLMAEIDLRPTGMETLKPGVEMLGFSGRLRVNFRVPSGWGIGKSSARGFGTLILEESDGQD
jgi:hypothetical protein